MKYHSLIWIIDQNPFWMNNSRIGKILLETVEDHRLPWHSCRSVLERGWRITLGRMEEIALSLRGNGKMDYKTGN